MLIKHLPVDRSSIDLVPIFYVLDTNTGSIHDWWIVAQPEYRIRFLKRKKYSEDVFDNEDDAVSSGTVILIFDRSSRPDIF